MKAQNSLSVILGNIQLSQDNIVKINEGYLKALTSNSNDIVVELDNLDGTKSSVRIPTNIFLNNELQRINASFKSVIGLSEDGMNRIISNDGEFREIIVSDYRPSIAPNDENMVIGEDVIISTNSIIENMISPLTQVEIKLDQSYKAVGSVYVTKYIVDDLDGLKNGMTQGEVKRFLNSNLRKYETVSFKQDVRTRTPRFFGEFKVNNVGIINTKDIEVTLESLKYSDSENLYLDTKNLTVGDKVVNDNGSSLYEVVRVDKAINKVYLNHIKGVGNIKVGSKLIYRSSDFSDVSVGVPIRINEKSIIFLQVVDKNSNMSSTMSTCKLFDSRNYWVNDNGIRTSFNEYFSAKVADIGRHIESMVRENLVPAMFGETPEKPNLLGEYLNVIQINSHLTNTANTEKIKKYQKEKDQLLNQITVLNTNISDLNSKLSDSNYLNKAKQNSDETQLSKWISEKNQKSELLDSLTKNIKSLLDETAEMTISPKYRVRGFWDVQKPIPSNFTEPQHIVQYDIRYRYLSNTGNTSNSSEMMYLSNDGNQINAVASTWTYKKTEPLEKSLDADGRVVWLGNDPKSVDKIAINQLDLPISYGESIEIQIRAISEAGYPTSPIKSEWSDVVRKDFPKELLQESDLSNIEKKNNDDLLKVQVMKEFSSQGITEHVKSSFKDGDTYYPHGLRNIASGKKSEEQKEIDAETYITALENRIFKLEGIVDRRYASVSVQVLDGDTMIEHDVSNNGTINLFAGNYADIVDINQKNDYGTIVTKKFYIKLVNRNAQTIEMLSLNSGVPNQNVLGSKYYNAPLYIVSTNESINQKKGQIFYLRNKNVNNTEDILVLDDKKQSTQITVSDIANNNYEAERNIVNLNGTNVELVALKKNASLDYVSMTTSHPSYLDYVNTGNKQVLDKEFSRISNFNMLYKSDNVQNATKEDLIIKYSQSDKHLIGMTTCGATMYVAMNDIKSFQVDGIDTASSKEINSGESDSILIPIEYQFRMTDALGNPNGLSSFSNSNFGYVKKMGVDLLVNGKLFSFDISIKSRFKSTSVSNTSIEQGGNFTLFNPNLDS